MKKTIIELRRYRDPQKRIDYISGLVANYGSKQVKYWYREGSI